VGGPVWSNEALDGDPVEDGGAQRIVGDRVKLQPHATHSTEAPYRSLVGDIAGGGGAQGEAAHLLPPRDPRFQPLPYAGVGAARYLGYRITRMQTKTLGALWSNYTAFNAECIPKDGPFLLLPNHTTFLDPFLIGSQCPRPMHYMASAALLRIPILGPYLSFLGAFPKIKYVKDRDAMGTVQKLWDREQGILIFPEGRRSWDGRTLPILPGIARLIRRLNARVVFARCLSSYLFQPRWAAWPRRVPVHIEFDGPYEFPAEWSDEELVRAVERGIATEPRLPKGGPNQGFRLAHGLPALLWACPVCLQLESVKLDPDHGDRIHCLSCRSAWRVGVDTSLQGEKNAPDSTVSRAWRDIQARYGFPPAADPGVFQSEGVALRGPVGRILEVPPGGRKALPVAEGAPTLTASHLELRDQTGAVRWSVALSELLAVSIEVGNRVQLRTEGGLFDLEPGGESILKWGHFIKAWTQPGQVTEAG
jgi:1-acyl-sn-glycerol-3-phosphate acyltransferase